MQDNKCGHQASNACKDTVCMDVCRVLDSCRDKDCFENVRVHLTDCSAELLDRITSIRPTGAEIVGANIFVDPVAFNRGFYQITVRYFIKVVVEGCVGPRPQMLEGIAVCEKRAILYGGEGNVHVFRSTANPTNPCRPDVDADIGDRLPKVICEAVDPVLLGAKIISVHGHDDYGYDCGCGCGCEIPDSILSCLTGCLCGQPKERVLTVTLGIFSVLRIERPCQCLVYASEYNVPDKICMMKDEEDPCSLFSKMAFPVSEFNQCASRPDNGCGCGHG